MAHARAIAAAQSVSIRGDVVANLEQHVRLARLAAREHARVVVFPELSLTGYELDLAGDLAFAERDARLAPLAELASSCRMTLLVGAPARIGSRLYIGTFIVAPDGTMGLYTKHHLGAFAASASADGIVPPAEKTYFHPGDLNPLVQFDGNTAAVAVCADTGHPSHPEDAAARGAKTYLASMFVIPSEFTREVGNLRVHATRHAMAVVFANYGGPSGGLASGGGSAIWSEKGDLLAQIEGLGAGVVIAIEDGAGWRAKAVMDA